MKIAFIGSSTSWYVRDLRRAASGAHEITSVDFDQMASHVSAEGTLRFESNQLDLGKFDIALIRTMANGSLEQVVLRMDLLHRLQQSGVCVINPAKAIEASVDKYLTLTYLTERGISVPETYVCQTAEQAMVGFLALGSDVVIKPIFGGEGRGITRVSDEQLAYRAFRMLEQNRSAIYLQRFIKHPGYDIRLFVLGEQVFGMRRENRLDWRTNVSRGATTHLYHPKPDEMALAISATRSVGAMIAGVDILHSPEGKSLVVEVNAVPGWKALANTLNLDIAQKVLEYATSARQNC